MVNIANDSLFNDFGWYFSKLTVETSTWETR